MAEQTVQGSQSDSGQYWTLLLAAAAAAHGETWRGQISGTDAPEWGH